MPCRQKLLQIELDRFSPIQLVDSHLNLRLQLGKLRAQCCLWKMLLFHGLKARKRVFQPILD